MSAFDVINTFSHFVVNGGLQDITNNTPKFQAALNATIDSTIKAIKAEQANAQNWVDALTHLKETNAALTPLVSAVKKAE